MAEPIRVGIVGYGNLGRGAELAIERSTDLHLSGIFTRRAPDSLETAGTAPVFALDEIGDHRHDVDVLVLCGGSKSDLPTQSPELAKLFSIVDSFDTHARVPEHFAAVHAAAEAAGTTAIIGAGWDPGLFSINRVFSEAILPTGETYTFWGRGLSQGHSDALRRIPGVAGAVQYTIPSETAIAQVRAGEEPELSTREKHTRECFVVLEDGVSEESVRAEIVNMPDYFEPYDTTVHFISAEDLARDHAGMPHGGFVIRSGRTSEGTQQVVEYRLELESNPEFTSSVLVAYARAAARLNTAGVTGGMTPFDVAPGLLSSRSPEELRRDYL